MKVNIVSVHGHGDFEKEYVLLKADQDCDLGKYMLADSTYNKDNTVSNKVRHTFWLPDMKLSANDYVAVWTKKGKTKPADRSAKTPMHHVYWNLATAVWNDDGDCSILFDLLTWQFHKAR
jgi:hypothetical protein